jgi:hypothetical protein
MMRVYLGLFFYLSIEIICRPPQSRETIPLKGTLGNVCNFHQQIHLTCLFFFFLSKIS